MRIFAPDPVHWMPRDLLRYTDKNSHSLDMDQVATDGKCNHLS